jgi:hypothetical protein
MTSSSSDIGKARRANSAKRAGSGKLSCAGYIGTAFEVIIFIIL